MYGIQYLNNKNEYCYYLHTRINRIQLIVVKHKRKKHFTDQECYEYIKNVKTSQTTQRTTESIYMESTTQEMVYSSSSLTTNEESARLYQNTDTPNTSSHV